MVVITERSTRALHTTLCICDTRVNRIVWLPNAAHLRWAAATRAVCGPCMVLTARWHVSQAAKPVTCLKNRVFGQNACFACRTLKKHVYKRGTRDTLVSGSLRAPSLAEPIHPPKSVRSFQRKRFFCWAKLLHPQKKTGFWSDPPGGRGRFFLAILNTHWLVWLMYVRFATHTSQPTQPMRYVSCVHIVPFRSERCERNECNRRNATVRYVTSRTKDTEATQRTERNACNATQPMCT